MAKKITSTSPEMKVEEVIHIPTPITFLSVDYPTEGLNDIARKINQIIERIN